MDCYGKFYQKTQHCNECQLNQYCREAADPPLLNEYRGEFNEKITDKIEKNFRADRHPSTDVFL